MRQQHFYLAVDQLITVEDNTDPTQTIETLAPVTLYLDGDCATDRSDAATGVPASDHGRQLRQRRGERVDAHATARTCRHVQRRRFSCR